MLYQFHPLATNKKDFGKVFNGHCAGVPNDDDWIQMMDWDCYILSLESHKVIANIIERHKPDGPLIYGAYTNRCGYPFQMLSNMYNNHDLEYNKKRAEVLAQLWPHEVRPIPMVAGFYMLFQKSYWIHNKYPDEIITGGRTFDKLFSHEAAKAGRLAIIEGLYVYHQYRLGKDEANRDHLKV